MMEAYLINPARMRMTTARVPEEWPPTREYADKILLDVYCQRLVARRDWALRHTQQKRGSWV